MPSSQKNAILVGGRCYQNPFGGGIVIYTPDTEPEGKSLCGFCICNDLSSRINITLHTFALSKAVEALFFFRTSLSLHAKIQLQKLFRKFEKLVFEFEFQLTYMKTMLVN